MLQYIKDWPLQLLRLNKYLRLSLMFLLIKELREYLLVFSTWSFISFCTSRLSLFQGLVHPIGQQTLFFFLLFLLQFWFSPLSKISLKKRTRFRISQINWPWMMDLPCYLSVSPWHKHLLGLSGSVAGWQIRGKEYYAIIAGSDIIFRCCQCLSPV